MRFFNRPAQIAVLAIVALYFLVWPVWRMPFPMEIEPIEGWCAYFADAAGGADFLYPRPGQLIVDNYPPLSFYLLGYGEKLFGDALYLGRILSLLATLGTGALIYRVVRQLGASRGPAAIAGVWFIAVMADSFYRYVGVNDPQMVAEAGMVAALSWFLARDRAGKSAEPAILLMVLAGFYKHNTVVIPATVLIWLLLRDGRKALRPAAVGIGAALAGLLLCVAFFGHDFVSNMLTPRPYSLARAWAGAGRLQWILPALIMWAVWAVPARREPLARFLMLYVGIGLLAYLVQWTGGDVLDSAQLDLVIASAIGLGIAFERGGTLRFVRRLGEERMRALVVFVLVLRLAATSHAEPFLLLTDAAYRAEFPANADVTRAAAARIATLPGRIACGNKLVCRMAGKPFLFDDFRADMILQTEAPPRTTTADLIRQHGLIYVNDDPRTSTDFLDRWFHFPRRANTSLDSSFSWRSKIPQTASLDRPRERPSDARPLPLWSESRTGRIARSLHP